VLESSTEHQEMSPMYNALNEQYMFQQLDDRAAAMRAVRSAGAARNHDRRWWRRSTRRAR
jgi:hypothetical protein